METGSGVRQAVPVPYIKAQKQQQSYLRRWLPSSDVQFPKWFGGSASCMAVVCSHPLHLFRMQTYTGAQRPGSYKLMRNIVRVEGFQGLYSGLTAGLLRQLTYGTTRFAIYESLKENAATAGPAPGLSVFVPAAAASGFVGGMVGTPADIINVRMQSDASLPPESRRNYRNAIEALVRLGREEGPRGYIRGFWPNCIRGAGMTSCQLASYDGCKKFLVDGIKFHDNPGTQLLASTFASLMATTVCSPFDVIKTQMMCQSGGASILQTVRQMSRLEGARWIFRGWLPSFVRLGPHTVACLLFMEQHKRLYRMKIGAREA